jgi:hypothetical protein
MRLNTNKCVLMLAVLTLIVVAGSTCSFAQSQTSNVTLTAKASESFNLTLSGNTVTWATVTPGVASNAPTIGDGLVVTTSWKLKGGRTSVKVYAYFDNATRALVHQDASCAGCIDIPASAVELKGGDVTSLTPVTGAGVGTSPAGSTLLLQSIALTNSNRNSGSTATLNFNLNLSSAAMQQLPADDYSGTLHIVADPTL